jgi:hypothetical protein
MRDGAVGALERHDRVQLDPVRRNPTLPWNGSKYATPGDGRPACKRLQLAVRSARSAALRGSSAAVVFPARSLPSAVIAFHAARRRPICGDGRRVLKLRSAETKFVRDRT